MNLNELELAQILVIFIIVALGLLLLAIYWFLFARRKQVPMWKLKLQRKLQELKTQDLDKRLELIEYDKLLEYGWQQRIRRKESLGAILKAEYKRFRRDELNAIWTAHKLRNKLVHDLDYKPEHSELNKSIIILKRATTDLLSS
jgi:hypothetical protein